MSGGKGVTQNAIEKSSAADQYAIVSSEVSSRRFSPQPRCALSTAPGRTADPLTIPTRSALEQQPFVIGKCVHCRRSFEEPLAAAKERPHPRFGQIAKCEEKADWQKSHPPSIEESKAVTLTTRDPLRHAHAQDSPQKPRGVNGLEKKKTAARANERHQMTERLLENLRFAAGHRQTGDGEADIETTHQIGRRRLERIVEPEVDGEPGLVCLLARRLQRARREIQPCHACAAAGQVAASTPSSARHIDHLETAHVAERPVE